jgi:thymidylate synthase
MAMENGHDSDDRTGTGTKFIVSKQFNYDISNGKIPIWTTRKINWKNQVWELIWFLKGHPANIKWLKERGVNIWDSWADENGYIGPTYATQMRKWLQPKRPLPQHEYLLKNFIKKSDTDTATINYDCEEIDQFKNLIDGIKNNPESRRHIIALWNPGEYHNLSKPYLPSCHSNHIQVTILNKKYLHYQMIQRSADFIVGFCPWQHALFANIIGKLTGYEPISMSILISNCHIYKNQFEAATELLKRTPTEFPTLKINKELKTIENVEDSILEDYELINYNPQPFIKIPISV